MTVITMDRAEVDRQTEAYIKAINEGIEQASKDHQPPAMNAVVAALSGVLGSMIGAVPPHLREHMMFQTINIVATTAAAAKGPAVPVDIGRLSDQIRH